MRASSSFRVYYDGEGGDGGTGGGGSGTGTGGSNTLVTGGAGGGGDGGKSGEEGAKTGAEGTNTTGAEFKLPEGWDYRSTLPPELKESPSAKKYANITELVRGADNLQQFVGRPTEHLVELAPNATPEAKRAALEKMGLPKEIGAYELKPLKGEAANLLKTDHPNFGVLKETAFKLGILPDQFQGFVEGFGDLVVKGQKDMAAAEIQRNADNIEALKGELGEAFDGDVAAANFAVKKLGGEELAASINKAGLGTDAPLLRMLSKVGKMLAEDEGGGDKPGGFGDGLTPDTAKAQAQDLLKQAINETDQMKRRELNAKAQELFARAEKRAK